MGPRHLWIWESHSNDLLSPATPQLLRWKRSGPPLSCLQVWLQLGMVIVLTEQSPTPESTWFSYKDLQNPGQTWLPLKLLLRTWLVCSFPQPSVGTFLTIIKLPFSSLLPSLPPKKYIFFDLVQLRNLSWLPFKHIFSSFSSFIKI